MVLSHFLVCSLRKFEAFLQVASGSGTDTDATDVGVHFDAKQTTPMHCATRQNCDKIQINLQKYILKDFYGKEKKANPTLSAARASNHVK